MKKFTFLALAFCGFVVANAQRVATIQVNVTKLAQNETIKTTNGFTPAVNFKNLGPDPILTGDTIFLQLGLDAQYSNQQDLTLYGFICPFDRPADSSLFFNGLKSLLLPAALPSGPHTWCGKITIRNGADLTPIVQEQCNDITVQNNASIFGLNSGSIRAFNASVYPNPATSATTISFGAELNKTYSVQVYDLAGREVASFNGVTSSDMTELNVDLKGLTSGLYTYKLDIDGMTAAGKIIKN